jgi:hypothetical protein
MALLESAGVDAIWPDGDRFAAAGLELMAGEEAR